MEGMGQIAEGDQPSADGEIIRDTTMPLG